MMWHGWDMGLGLGWGGWLVGGLLMLLFWGGVIALAFFAIRALMRSGQGRAAHGSPRQGGEEALDIAQERYARGDISREEYLELKQTLET
jgi:putative membrane protein